MKRHGRKRSLLNRARTNARLLTEKQDRGEVESPAPGYTSDTMATIPEPTEPELKPPMADAEERLLAAIATLRQATAGTPYENNVWIVGGYVRDKLLGLRQEGEDVDLVMQANALELANLLNERGVTEIAPVVYPRFGTAMVRISGCDVELVTARKESYADDSRKPAEVQPATLEEDALRRDFTINTLLENLHTSELRDPTGQGLSDLRARCLRTPLPPEATFADDPLRMLRAIRFAAKLGFTVSPHTWDAVCANAKRLAPPKVSFERVRDEFCKMLMAQSPSQGLEMLRRSGLLEQFATELCETVGVTQNEFHALPVWDHTLLALDNLVDENPQAPLLLRLATLLHDIGKPRTKSIGEDGRIHFYGHEDIGAAMARQLLARLKFSMSDMETVTQLVAQHMRIGEYKPERWSDSAVRRLVREAGGKLDGLFALHRADVSALSDEHQDVSRAKMLRERIEELESAQPSAQIASPLSGEEIMAALDLPPGPEIGRWKEWLLGEVLEGQLASDDKEEAVRMLRDKVRSKE